MQRKINKPYVYKFNDAWLKMPMFIGWLEKMSPNDQPQTSTEEVNKNESSFCKVCSVRLLSHKTVLKKHADSSKHKDNAKRVAENVKITSLFRTSDLTKRTRIAELKLCGLIATNNLPFSFIDSLIPLLKSIAPDSEIIKEITLKRTKCTAIMTESLGKCFLEILSSKLREPGCFFSLIMDETTDISTKKQCAFAVIYYDYINCNIVTSFFDIVEAEGGKANELFDTLIKTLVDKNIPISNLIAFSSDTTNVMAGNYHSVFALLKNEIPNILCVKCSCHMAHLAISRACLKLPRSIEDLVRNVGSHFSRSPMRNERLREFQSFFKTDIHKILKPAITRWLSLKQCVDRILEQFQPLKEYFTELLFEDPSLTTDEILSTMNNQFTKIYLEFMSYVLGLMSDFNILFQTNKPLLHKLKPETVKLLTTICSNFIEIEVIRKNDIFQLDHKNPKNFVKLENIYIGISAHDSFQSLTKVPEINQACHQFLKTVLDFYIDLVSNIKNKFIFDDPIYELLSVIEPKQAQSFQNKSLKPIIDRFPILSEYIEMQELDNEWRQHALLDHKKLNLEEILDAEDYWKNIFKLKNAAGVEIFLNLKKVVCFLLILPFSNACVERIFSDIFNIKSDKRNLLHTSTLKAILASKQGIAQGGGCVKFEPDSNMINCNIWNKKT